MWTSAFSLVPWRVSWVYENFCSLYRSAWEFLWQAPRVSQRKASKDECLYCHRFTWNQFDYLVWPTPASSCQNCYCFCCRFLTALGLLNYLTSGRYWESTKPLTCGRLVCLWKFDKQIGSVESSHNFSETLTKNNYLLRGSLQGS